MPNSGIVSITLPNSVTTIGEGAFNACRSLTNITLPNNAGFTAIPDQLFFECRALESLTIPESVASIGEDVFNGCKALSGIIVDEDNESYSSENGVLYNADKTILLCHPAGRSGVFEIPNGITEIGKQAFLNSTLSGISIPDGVTTIGEGAFFNCLKAEFEMPVLPDSVTSIGAYAFHDCRKLTEIAIPEGVTVIGEYMFYNCIDLSILMLPESMTGIAEGAFMSCGNLDEITIPQNVTSIGVNAFSFCSGLRKVVIHNMNTGFGSGAFILTSISSDGIYGLFESTAQTYAQTNSIPFHMLYTVSFSSGGGSTVSDIFAASGSVIAAPSNPTRTGYGFDGWFKDAACTDEWDFINDKVTGDMILYAKWSADSNTGDSGSGGDGGGGTTQEPQKPVGDISGNTYTATTTVTAKTDSSGKTTAAVTKTQVNDAVNKAVSEAEKQGSGTRAVVEIKVETSNSSNVNSVETSIPKDAVGLAVSGGAEELKVSTPIASLSFDTTALSTIFGEASGDVNITASKVDAASLPAETQQLVGDRPVFNFSVTSGNQTISQFGGNVTASVPYTPKAGEDTDAIVIYYINSQGQPEMVSNCAYDPASGTVSFTTDHFSQYAVGYNEVSFHDVKVGAWYENAVDFVAARGIVTGTGNGNFDPTGQLTRGQLLVMLMRAYGIEADTDRSSNFSDAGNTYYTGYLAAAKRLGITEGIGDNKYAPNAQITRQEMFTLLYNTLKQMDALPAATSGAAAAYSDGDSVASWAKEAAEVLTTANVVGGSDGKLSPKDTTSRAEMAQVIYNLLAK